MKDRLQKILARAGCGSRRACEELIRQGRVAVNGRQAKLGQKADPERDRITLDGRPVESDLQKVYVALHKPRGILSDKGDDSQQSGTVHDLVPLPTRLFSVGRLDLHSEGLILLTNDGELAHRLTHPRYEHEKEYRVYVEGRPGQKTLNRWRRGVFLDGKRTAPAQVKVLSEEKEHSWLCVVLREGRKRQIRRVAAMLGHPVQRLIRVRIGPIRLGELEPRQWRRLTPAEVAALQADARKERA
ncbi:MAG: rRNA pseudouridine synthase [Anaerolineae bacterium]|nr:rRNA pseudouridine synthase [Anaerolineae bacterium]